MDVLRSTASPPSSVTASRPVRRRRPVSLAALVLALGAGQIVSASDARSDGPAEVAAGVAATSADPSGTGGANALRPRWIAPLRLRPEADDARPAPSRFEARPEGRGVATATAGTARDDSDLATAGASRRDVRIVIHGERADARLVDLIDDTLRALGAMRVERRTVPVGPADDQVRYFHATDAAAARALAGELESVFDEVRVHDLTHYRPAPARGLLELWLRRVDGGEVAVSAEIETTD